MVFLKRSEKTQGITAIKKRFLSGRGGTTARLTWRFKNVYENIINIKNKLGCIVSFGTYKVTAKSQTDTGEKSKGKMSSLYPSVRHFTLLHGKKEKLLSTSHKMIY